MPWRLRRRAKVVLLSKPGGCLSRFVNFLLQSSLAKSILILVLSRLRHFNFYIILEPLVGYMFMCIAFKFCYLWLQFVRNLLLLVVGESVSRQSMQLNLASYGEKLAWESVHVVVKMSQFSSFQINSWKLPSYFHYILTQQIQPKFAACL